MIWSEFREKTIKLLNAYSQSGNLVDTTDSSVVDEVLRLPEFADIIQTEIATTAKYIHKKQTITQIGLSPYISTNPKYIEYVLPADYFNINKVEFNFNMVPYLWRGRNTIAVKSDIDGDIDIFYYAYPSTIPTNPLDSYTFELDKEACNAIPFGVAGLILNDSPVNKSAGEKLYAMYQNKLANMTNAITQNLKSVKNSMYTINDSKLL